MVVLLSDVALLLLVHIKITDSDCYWIVWDLKDDVEVWDECSMLLQILKLGIK